VLRPVTETGKLQALVQPARRVLVAENEIFLAAQIEDCLTDEGYKVIDVVYTAEDAIAVALIDKPDLIIMDVRLTGAGDGIAAACEILARTGIRSIFATAHADEETRVRGSVACPVAWLEKPFGVECILEAVRLAFQDRSGNGITTRLPLGLQ
jgi:DNA-binding response OmpR family regulator